MDESAHGAAVPLTTVLGITVAAALVPLNSTMIAVALPSIADAFDISTAQVSILVTSYLVCMLIGQPLAGRISDRIGSGTTLRSALVGLAVFSALAALAGAFWLLVVARVLQAVCAAALSPGAQAMLRGIAPPQMQGRVFGIFGSVLGAGAAAGPVVGGVLVAVAGWRAIFVVNVPIALAALVTSRRSTANLPTTHRDETPRAGRAIANRVFVAGFSAQALSTQAQYALLLMTPIVLDARGWSAGAIGLMLSALTVGTIVSGPPGGRLGDRRGRRFPSVIGLVVAGVPVAVLAAAGGSVSPAVLVVCLTVFGLGFGATTPNFVSAALGSVPGSVTGTAAGVFTTSRYVGSITTTVLIASWVSADGDGAAHVLTASTVCMAVALVAARFLPTTATDGLR